MIYQISEELMNSSNSDRTIESWGFDDFYWYPHDLFDPCYRKFWQV